MYSFSISAFIGNDLDAQLCTQSILGARWKLSGVILVTGGVLMGYILKSRSVGSSFTCGVHVVPQPRNVKVTDCDKEFYSLTIDIHSNTHHKHGL